VARHAVATRAHHVGVGFAGVVVEHQALAQFRRVFALEVVEPAVRGIAGERAVVRDELAATRVDPQHFRDGAGVAGPDETAGKRQAEGRVRRMVAGREHAEPGALVPEAARMRHQRKGIPEIGAALGQHVGVVSDARLQQRHERGVRMQPHLPAQCVVEVRAVEQALESADMVHVGMGDEERPRRLAVAGEVGRQRFGAAVDHQQRHAIALQHAAGGTQFRRLRATDAEEAQRKTHGCALPVVAAPASARDSDSP
jgi:hypothetical protein